MPVTFIGVRHHSPACSRLVRDTLRELTPAYVLIEGPADMNDRLDELLLGHQLPIAVFTSIRDEQRHHASWTPFCEHSPEWVALTEGRRLGADVRFIDLPAWHHAFSERANRYADPETRYTEAVSRICEAVGIDDTDALWDHLFEINGDIQLQQHLDAYFELIRGDEVAYGEDVEREGNMARWIAAADATGEQVVVITGGFHRPALVRALTSAGNTDWPELPVMPPDAVGGSYLVPFSFRRLDAFDGYQSGMPSPAYYQQVWDEGVEAAAAGIVTSVVERLRARRQPVSTADLIGARTLSLGLAELRGHDSPGRVDVLEGLTSLLITDALDTRLPWQGRGTLRAGTDPVVVEMVAALSGNVVGRLHPSTPHPPLVHDVEAELERHGVPPTGHFDVDLTVPDQLSASRVLHRLRVLAVDGIARVAGPIAGGSPVLVESWQLSQPDTRLPSIIEAGSYGATLSDAAAACLADRLSALPHDAEPLAEVLFDATLCGYSALSERLLADIRGLIATLTEIGGLGRLLLTTLGLWRHDRLLGAVGSPGLAQVVDASTTRLLWLLEGIRGGGPASSDSGRLEALVGVRDAVVHAEAVLSTDRENVLAVASRCAQPDRPPDVRGASVGLIWALDEREGLLDYVSQAVRRASRPDVLGDFLAGVFALSREQVIAGEAALIPLLDEVFAGFDDHDFLIALPSLRLAFSWFPPREREQIALQLLALRGLKGSGRALLRLQADPGLLARARAVEARVDDLLEREALGGVRG